MTAVGGVGVPKSYAQGEVVPSCGSAAVVSVAVAVTYAAPSEGVANETLKLASPEELVVTVYEPSRYRPSP